MNFPYHTESISQHVHHFKSLSAKIINLIFEPFPTFAYYVVHHPLPQTRLIQLQILHEGHPPRPQEFLHWFPRLQLTPHKQHVQ